MFFQPVEPGFPGLTPFEGFPIAFHGGSLSAIVTTDELGWAVFLHNLTANALSNGPVYHVGPVRGVSTEVLKRLVDDVSGLYLARAYSTKDIVQAFNYVEDGSLVVVSGFPLLPDRREDDVLEIRRSVDEKGLIAVLVHHTLEFNELDLPGEFKRLYILPELFDSLIVIRANSYRGHYKLGVTVLKAPPDQLSARGEHLISADSLVRKIVQTSK